MPQQVNVYRELKMFPGAILTGSLGPLFDTGGTTYYVNNITGTVGGSGLSWNEAVSEPVYAITASAAARSADRTATNLIMDTIVMQGTGSRYTPLATMPLYTNMIGLGSNPKGHVFGQVRIGAIAGEDGSVGDEAGNYWYNIQFSAGGSFAAVDLGVSFSSTWDNVAWGCAADNAALNEGIAIGTGSGSTFVNCASLSGHSATPVLGFSTEGTFNDCLLENCHLRGSTAAFQSAGALNDGTNIHNCTFKGGTRGVNDTGSAGAVTAGPFYTGCYAHGTTAGFTLTNNAAQRAVGNVQCSSSTNATFSIYTTIAT